MVVQLGFAVSCMHASLKENTSSPLVITEAAALVQISTREELYRMAHLTGRGGALGGAPLSPAALPVAS